MNIPYSVIPQKVFTVRITSSIFKLMKKVFAEILEEI